MQASYHLTRVHPNEKICSSSRTAKIVAGGMLRRVLRVAIQAGRRHEVTHSVQLGKIDALVKSHKI